MYRYCIIIAYGLKIVKKMISNLLRSGAPERSFHKYLIDSKGSLTPDFLGQIIPLILDE